eukprot:Sspe_Gene.38446::Locus_18526_Transcript_1_7_Confidence_0.222_Length_593::g.38446::m.38446
MCVGVCREAPCPNDDLSAVVSTAAGGKGKHHIQFCLLHLGYALPCNPCLYHIPSHTRASSLPLTSLSTMSLSADRSPAADTAPPHRVYHKGGGTSQILFHFPPPSLPPLPPQPSEKGRK